MWRNLAAAIATVAMAAEVTPLGKGVNFYSLEDEREIGAKAVDAFRSRVRLEEDPAVVARLSRIVADLEKQVVVPFRFSVSVFDDSAAFPEAEAAFPHARAQLSTEPVAFAGGPIYVPASLLTNVRSDGELAGVLAHAMAHIADRHVTRLASRLRLIDSAAGGLPERATHVVLPAAMRAVRDFEVRADVWAARWLRATGYDVGDYVSYLKRLNPSALE
jgi:Zn-dependent protease with chaperone function